MKEKSTFAESIAMTRPENNKQKYKPQKFINIMAKVIYEVYKSTNSKSASYGKYFARSKSIETLNLKMLSRHIAEHGSVYTEDVVQGVLLKFKSCLLEMLLSSHSVKIDGLGTFYTTIQNRAGADDPSKFNISENVRGLHIRFRPDMEQELGLSSPEFLKKASFINAASITSDGAYNGSGGNGDDVNP